MDGQRLYPEGYHPQYTRHKPDYTGHAKHLTRTQRPVKYYFIDFGLSRRYNPADGPPLELPIIGGDKSVPEFRDPVGPLDPFPTDVYYLGNMIRREFLDGFPEMYLEGRHGFDFMRPLVQDMVQDDPAKRPTMDEVVTRFEAIQKGLSSWKLRSRVIPRKDDTITSLPHLIGHWWRKIGFIIRRVPAIPRP